MSYIILPNDLLEKKYNVADQTTFISLMKYKNNETNKCFPSIKTLAEESRLSERQVRYSLDKFEENNLIKIQHTYNKSNIYIINIFEKFTIIPIEIFQKYQKLEISAEEFIFYVKLLKLNFINQNFLDNTNDQKISIKSFYCRAYVKKQITELENKNLIKINQVNKNNYNIKLMVVSYNVI